MATIPFREQLGQGVAAPNAPGMNIQLSSSEAGVTGAGANAGGVNKSAQGPAPGWTNIQDYLKANAGDNQTSEYVKNTYGKKVEEGQSELQKQTQKYTEELNKAKDVVTGGTGAKQKVLQGINQGGDYAASPWYGQIKSFLAGPQNIPQGTNVQVDQATLDANRSKGGLIEGTYQQAGLGGPGMYALQRGLDQPNVNVQNTLKDTSQAINTIDTQARDTNINTARDAQTLADQWNNQLTTEKQGLSELYGSASERLNDAISRANQTYDSYDPQYEYAYQVPMQKAPPPEGADEGVWGISDRQMWETKSGKVGGLKDVVRADASNILNANPNLDIYGRQANVVADLIGGNKYGGSTGIPGVTAALNQAEWDAIKAMIAGQGGRITKDPTKKPGSGAGQVKPIVDYGSK